MKMSEKEKHISKCELYARKEMESYSLEELKNYVLWDLVDVIYNSSDIFENMEQQWGNV